MPSESGMQFYDHHVRVGQMWWLGIPPLQLRRGVHRATITGVRLASHYPGVVLVATARFSLGQTGNGVLTLEPADALKHDRDFKPTGPFVGTTELPGNPADFGAVEVRFDRPGVFHVVDFVLTYRTPNGSGEQTIASDYELTVRP